MNRNRLLLMGLGLVVVVAAGWFIVTLTRPPQMGADEEVFNSVDALFTAVTARDEKLLGQCQQRLHASKDAGKLPAEASGYLDGVIAKARVGHWEAAAQQLYEFMKAQRREGARDHPRRKEKGSPNSGRK